MRSQISFFLIKDVQLEVREHPVGNTLSLLLEGSQVVHDRQRGRNVIKKKEEMERLQECFT